MLVAKNYDKYVQFTKKHVLHSNNQNTFPPLFKAQKHGKEKVGGLKGGPLEWCCPTTLPSSFAVTTYFALKVERGKSGKEEEETR